MSEQIDWSKAPEGATHYYQITEEWYLSGDGCVPRVWAGMWCKAFLFAQREHECIKRPSTQSWSGEGLPPVGAVCGKCYNSPSEYYNVKVLAHDSHYGEVVIYRWIEGPLEGELDQSTMHLNMASGSNAHWSFRPIRTPEQIAADEREAAIDQMVADTQAAHGWTEAFGMLHDKGYRKP